MLEDRSTERPMTRRAVLARSAALLGLLLSARVRADSGVQATRAAITALIGEREAESGGIELITPPIAENGNTVPVSVAIDSPFTPDDYVKAVHVFAEENPSPEVASFYFTPASGTAKIATRIRLAKTQNVIVVAELSDGRVLRTANEVKVTIGGCGG